MKKLFIALLLVTTSAFAGETTIKVQGMVCSMCAQGIKKKFSVIKEVKGIDVNLDQKVVRITTEEGKSVDDEKIKKIITEAGYNVASIERK